MKRIFASLLLAALAVPAFGQPPCRSCQNGQCLPSFTPASLTLNAYPNAVKIEWRQHPDHPDAVRYLFVDGQQRGAYRWSEDIWQDFDPAKGKWDAPVKLFNWSFHAAIPLGQ